MKKFTFVFALVCLALVSSSSAAAKYHSVIIHHSGMATPTTAINLSDNPVIRFNDLEMTVSCDNSETVIIIPKDQVERFEHSTEAGIADVGTDSGAPVIANGSISFSDLPAGSRVEVYDLAGRLCLTQTAEGSYTLDLTTLGSGVFLVKVNSLTFKIATK